MHTCTHTHTHTQANYGGVSVKLPKALAQLFNDEADEDSEAQENSEDAEEWEEGGEEGEGGRTEVEMKWNICKYLPEAAACQDIFRVSTF